MDGDKQEPQEPIDFISTYLTYTAKTECPTFFHRWTAITCLAAWIGRDIHFPFGHFKIHANMYVMLIGLAGTKKSTAVKIGANLLAAAGYKKFAANKTRQEKFLMDLSEGMDSEDESELQSMDDILEQNIFGSDSDTIKVPAEAFIAADEINNFIGVNNLDFMSILGELWDYDKPYKYKLKNSKSVTIYYPTITILGGNTFEGFNRLFPPEAIEQGFFSRMLFIYAEPTGVKYTIPERPNEEMGKRLIAELHEIKKKVQGEISITPNAYELLDKIYKSDRAIDDVRFNAYENRRLQHLLKLCMLISASKASTVINRDCIIEANTILSFTENLMPKALGEFGKARNSGITHKVMSVIDNTELPITTRGIWKLLHQDFEGLPQLMDILGNLTAAEKIQVVEGRAYLPIKKVREEGVKGAVDWNLLTDQERGL